MMELHRKHAPFGACFLCVLRQDRQRDEHEVRRRGAAVYGVSVLRCRAYIKEDLETNTGCEALWLPRWRTTFVIQREKLYLQFCIILSSGNINYIVSL